jgi:subtilisin family serine protease
VNAPDLAEKSPATWSVLNNSADVTDHQGHGTFVSSLAAGSSTNGDGVAGFGGDAKLLDVQAAKVDGTITDVDSAAAIVYAVDHGADIINMSYGGPTPSATEQNAIGYAAGHGVLLVAAAGNDGAGTNLPMYPAAFLQPLLSNGQGGSVWRLPRPTSPARPRTSRTGARTSRSPRRGRTFSGQSRPMRARAPGRTRPCRARAPASTATTAAPRSRLPRSRARPRSCGRRIRR